MARLTAAIPVSEFAASAETSGGSVLAIDAAIASESIEAGIVVAVAVGRGLGRGTRLTVAGPEIAGPGMIPPTTNSKKTAVRQRLFMVARPLAPAVGARLLLIWRLTTRPSVSLRERYRAAESILSFCFLWQ
jgi:hypothetical protein